MLRPPSRRIFIFLPLNGLIAVIYGLVFWLLSQMGDPPNAEAERAGQNTAFLVVGITIVSLIICFVGSIVWRKEKDWIITPMIILSTINLLWVIGLSILLIDFSSAIGPFSLIFLLLVILAVISWAGIIRENEKCKEY